MANLRADNLTGTGGRNAIDGSLFFNGNYDGLAIPSIALGSGDWTIEFWFYSTKEGSQDGHIYDGRGTGSASSAYPIIKFDTNEKLSFYTTGAIRIQGSSVVELGSWNHVALVKNSSTTTLYLNGVSEGTYSDSNTYLAPSNSIGRIGSDDGGSGYYFYGFLSNYRFVKGTAVYTAAFTPPTEKLKPIDGTVLLCCQDSDDPTQEATGKTITAYGNLDYSLRDYNLITNGNFDSSATDGWTVASGSAALGTGQSGTFGDGNHLVLTSGTMTQAFTTVIGRTYFVNAQSNGADSSFISTTASSGDAIITDIRSSPQTGSGVRGQKSFVATQTTYYVILTGGGGGGNFDTVSVYEAESPKAPKVLPPVGVDEGVTFEGDTKINSQGVMYFPTGDTSQRGRGTALYGGGYKTPNSITAIDSLSIQSGGLTEEWGNLSSTQLSSGAALGSSTRWVTAGGWTGANNDAIEYVEFPTQGNSIEFGELVVGRRNASAVSNSTRGIWGGGYVSPADAGTPKMDYITIATKGDAADFGDLSGNSKSGTATGSTTRAVFALGNVAPADVATLEYVEIATLSDYTNFGDLTSARSSPGSCSSNVRGIYSGGGYPTSVNSIDYITIASTGNATDFGDLFLARGQIGGTSNGTRGVFMGGTTNPARQETIDSITIATTGNAVNWGDFRTAKQGLNSAASDSHGGL